jgi:hypothetical protein
MKRISTILIALFLSAACFAQGVVKYNNDCVKKFHYSFIARFKITRSMHLPEFSLCHSKKMRQAIKTVFPEK